MQPPYFRLRRGFRGGGETRGKGNKEASLEATCKFMPISSLSGLEIRRVGSNWLELQTVEKTTAHMRCCSSVPPSA